MKELKAVIFDMDGLMFDTERVGYEQTQRAADELGLDYDIETFKAYLGVSEEEVFDYFHKRYAGEAKLEDFISLTSQYIEETLKDPNNVYEKPGLYDLLDYLKSRQIKLYLASSSRRHEIMRNLEGKGIADRFEGLVAGDEVERAKPDPEIYLKAYGLTELEDKQAVLVLEDSKNGLRAAYQAGLPTVLVPDMMPADEEMKDKAVAVKDSLAGVIDYIESEYA
ncbi:HAD family hydrolase [Aerococcus sanguinicola]|uniref:HAD family phosphatase n=1 Tax=Aerococcus sanguinicola TaxID=119206 RepID=A0A2I1MQA2_9LACT|nr:MULTISPECIES: HAD family phosphatase [Aerococcus]MDK7050086.1 HAD family phosphatase [Aerococcus sanguinicola]OFT93402.1 hypothetical protein HMPREF3090_07110 [Aerococcus sp. HMSC23C02]PKZ22313.1 HAD family phosphatase [Aerococcus sanguinicola]